MQHFTQDFYTWADMGGYAAYIWPAYGAAALILLAMAAFSRRELTRAKKANGED